MINRSGRARYSNPFFFDPHMLAEITPLTICVTAENPARFAPVVYGNYLAERLNANHAQHQEKQG